MAKQLVTDFFDNRHHSVGRHGASKLIAAYLIGIPLSASTFKHVPVCEEAEQTNCFLSWSTSSEDAPKVAKWWLEADQKLCQTMPAWGSCVKKPVCVNPVTWKAFKSDKTEPKFARGTGT